MKSIQTYLFSKPGWGELVLELEDAQKQVYKSTIDNFVGCKFEGIGQYPSIKVNEIYFFEWQNIHYEYTVEKDNNFNSPFELRINNRVEKVSKESRIGIHVLSGQFSFEDEVGQTRIEIRDSKNLLIFGLDAEVFPQKMDYKSDYKAMMIEISSVIQNLAFDSLKDTFRTSRTKVRGQVTENEWWSILNALFENLILSLRIIKRQPKHEIKGIENVCSVEKIKHPSKKNIKWLQRNAKYVDQKNGIKFSENSYFTHALSEKKNVTYDTYENRFVAWGIKKIIERLRKYKLYIANIKGTLDYSPFLKKIIGYQRTLQGILHENPFNEVGDFEKRSYYSTSLTSGSGYRDFMNIYLLLMRGLEIASSDIFRIEQKNISTLYEYWCFLMLVKILKEQHGSEIEYQTLISINAGKFSVNLVKGNESVVKFTNSLTNETASVFFNKGFSRSSKSSFTYDQKPDFAIEFKKNNFDKSFWYLFDAKYRFEENPKGENNSFSVPQDAIGQLHRYRDAILHSEPNDLTYRAAIKNLGGIILYPYPLSEEKYIDNIYFNSIGQFNIGALPFLPSKTSLVSSLLTSLLNKTPEEHFERFIDMDRSEYEAHRNLWSEWVTIGVVPTKNQSNRLIFLRNSAIYHIPFVANSNSKLYRSKKLLICISGTNRAFQYDVKSWEIMTEKELKLQGTTWSHNFENM